MHTTDYRVRLEAFEGPLDLLLYLIRRAEVEVTEIPVGVITDQYMDYMHSEGLAAIDIEKAGEFLVMAATLVEIKSRMLVPKKPGEGGEEEEGVGLEGEDQKGEDPRAELVRQLLAYKKFRDAADSLQHRLEEWESRYPAHAAAMDKERLGAALTELADVDLEDLELVDLVEAFARVIETVDMNRVGEHRVVVDDTPIEIHAEDILDKLRREGAKAGGGGEGGGEVEFVRFFTGKTRSEIIGLFMAMLELVRQRKVRVSQDEASGSIVLGLGEAETAPPDSSSPPPNESTPA